MSGFCDKCGNVQCLCDEISQDKTRVPSDMKNALAMIFQLREALLLYHEAWNGCEGDWRTAMRIASRNADQVLYPKAASPAPAQRRP